MKLERQGSPSRLDLPPTLLLTDEERLPDPVGAAQRQPRGGGIIVRNYNDPHREGLLRELSAVSKQRGLVFIVAGHPHLALQLGADGCHLPEHLHHLIPRAKAAKSNLLVTTAAHSLPALFSARAKGADAALVSPIFPTKSHENARSLGSLRLAQWAYQIDLPLYPLGGITSLTAQQLRGIPLAGLSGIGGF